MGLDVIKSDYNQVLLEYSKELLKITKLGSENNIITT